MTAWRSLLTALRHPATAGVVPRLGRRVLLEPRIFDLVSCLMQLRDVRAVAKIREDLPRDTFYAKVADYNMGVTERKVITTTRRAEIYYQTLALPPRDTSVETLLIVGPRNVHELLIAWLYGYRWRNIHAIDLYSTNPKIHVMNMEEMTFPDDTFDAVVMSNTLAYSRDTFRCLFSIRSCKYLKAMCNQTALQCTQNFNLIINNEDTSTALTHPFSLLSLLEVKRSER